ncbi:MAG: substrate-binding domain-containing protein [Opitutales bacterium]
MAKLRFLTKSEQLAGYLRGELAGGRWEEQIPGREELAAELGVNARTAEDALRQLEREGVLVPQGVGRRRKIALPQEETAQRRLIIGMLLYDKEDRKLPHHVDLVHRMQETGYRMVYAERTMIEMGMDLGRVAREVEGLPKLDAWIVQGGSREILEWFIERDVPVIAEFGRFVGLPIAGVGVRKIPALQKAVRHLHELGHRRIVMLAREERRKPYPAAYEQAFLDELTTLGIRTGRYNLPDWKNNTAAFHSCLDALFQHTPPTALLLNEAHLFVAAQQHLAHRGLVAPRDISIICDDPDRAFAWCHPTISHIYWDSRPLVSQILRWADRVARRIEDKRQRFTHGEWIKGGTIGPVPLKMIANTRPATN